MSQRYKLTIEYDGRPFYGWQRQKEVISVQEVIEDAFLKFCIGERIVVHGSGRTDAGVHAMGQVAHVDIDRDITLEKLKGALNFHMIPHPITILKTELVDKDFDARHSAKKRYYKYRIVNRRGPLTFDRGLAWHVKEKLDIAAMEDAAQVLVGHHDFTTFRAAQCQSKSPLKTVDKLSFETDGDEVYFFAEARSFLHHQIRSFIGSLKLVGDGSWTKEDLKKSLEARDRNALGHNAPADGLYFMKVDF